MRVRLLPLPVALLLAACNQPPEAPQIALNPGQPTTTDDISVLFLALTADGNAKDAVTHTFQWFQDGTLRPDLTTDTVPAGETTKGEVWKVVVVPNDGRVDGTAAEAGATVVNTPPVATASLAADPTTEVDLVMDVTSEDADEDDVTYTYAWTRDGAPTELAGFSVPASETTHGETWTVTVTPNDGEEDGEPVTATIVVANSAPTVESVELAPSPAFEDSLIMATVVGADDLDADEITFTYTWFVDDVEVQSGQDDTLTGALFSKHQLVRVEVTPNDGFVDGAAVVSADLLVENTVPVGTGAIIVSSSADGAVYESSTATFVPSGWSDIDGDAEGWTYAWTVDGVEVSTAQTIDGALFSRDQAIVCVATPFDGETSGAPLTSAAVTVSNTVPVLASASLSTLTPTENDTLTVTLGSVVDDDGDAVVYGYDWYVNGSVVSTSSTLLPNRFAKGDSLYVVVTPYDGTGYGAAVTSDTATGTNTPPVATRVTLSPTEVYTNDTLTASVTATDIDGDTLSYTYDWYVDGFPRGSTTSASLDGATWFDRDQDVYVVVTPNDGEADGTAATSDAVTVSNSAPTAPGVEITPADPVAGDDLTCSVVTESTDADGDAIAYAFAWDVDGAAYSDATDAAMSSVVDGGDVANAALWMCEVTAGDGSSAGGASIAERFVGVDVDDGLVAYLPLNGSLVADGPADYSITSSGVAYTADRDGNAGAALLVSAGGWVKVADVMSFGSNSPATMMGWVYYTSPVGTYPNALTLFWSEGSCGSSAGLAIGDDSTTGLQWAHISHACVYSADVSQPATRGEWHHWAVSYSGSVIEVFVDGASIGSESYGGAYVDPVSVSLVMGGGLQGTYAYFAGALDEVRVYDRALSASEIQYIMDL